MIAMGGLLGAMPFAVWLGRLAGKGDVRRHGDGNPGAANAWRAGGWPLGLAVLLLDWLKGAIPVSLAHFACGLSSWNLAVVALMPVLGHAFSPFLRWRGGKGLTVSFGIWTGLTLWEVPVFLGISLGLLHFLLPKHDAWVAVIGMMLVLPYLLLWGAPLAFGGVWLGNMLILLWKYRQGLWYATRASATEERPMGGNQ
ncbi:MAG: glycerol-3-phosphate acyltransferase [Anaerolineae bacterium]